MIEVGRNPDDDLPNDATSVALIIYTSGVGEAEAVHEGSALGMGVFIGKSTTIVDRETGTVRCGGVPAGSVVVAGSMHRKNGVSLYCAVIIKERSCKHEVKPAFINFSGNNPPTRLGMSDALFTEVSEFAIYKFTEPSALS